MRFLLDESADFRISAFLESHGHDVKSIAKDFTASIRDEEVLSCAFSEQRILITNDTDFGELIFRRGLPHSGVLLFRVRNESDLNAKLSALSMAINEHQEELSGFVVIGDRGIRVRRTP